MFGRIIYVIGGIIEALVGLRILLELLGANPSTPVVRFIYDYSTPLVAPFAGILGQDSVIGKLGVVVSSVFDWTALVALVIYAIVFGLIGTIVGRR